MEYFNCREGVVFLRFKPIISFILIVILMLGVFKLYRFFFYAQTLESPVERKPKHELTTADRIVLGARDEAKKRVVYDASYQAISYPGGDVSPERGSCTDVVIRALRNAGYDLQVLIHEDMKANFHLYPQVYGLTAPDTNIDHRRVRNQMVYFTRFGESLPLTVEAGSDWQWGDIVCWRFANGQLHTGVVSDKVTSRGVPLVIHNGSVTVEEDCLETWQIIGHFRFPTRSN